MKFLTIFFSVIVLLLTVVPCCSYDNCKGEQVHQEQSNQPEIPCSPFVHCTCTSAVCITPIMAFTFFPETLVEKKDTQYLQLFLSAYYSSIWQPPKKSC